MKQPTTIIAEALPCNIKYGRGIAAGEIVQALRREGWIVVRHDAIRLAQAHARADPLPPSANDNNPAVASYERSRQQVRKRAAARFACRVAIRDSA